MHANPYLGKIYIYELEPNQVYRYQKQIRFPPGSLIRLQVCDSLILIHNLDEKSTQLYDLKITDYTVPLLKPNVQVS